MIPRDCYTFARQLINTSQQMNHTVKVIIPIYKESLKDWERASLENTMRVLSAYPIVFLTPPD